MYDTTEKPGKIIRSIKVANELLNMGNQIISIKPDKADPEGRRGVYVFLQDEKFDKDMDEVMRRRKQEREDAENARIDSEVERRLAERLREMSEE